MKSATDFMKLVSRDFPDFPSDILKQVQSYEVFEQQENSETTTLLVAKLLYKY